MQTRLVEPSVESLNSADSFILVTEKYLHVWNGKDSNVVKKSKVTINLGQQNSGIYSDQYISTDRHFEIFSFQGVGVVKQNPPVQVVEL